MAGGDEVLLGKEGKKITTKMKVVTIVITTAALSIGGMSFAHAADAKVSPKSKMAAAKTVAKPAAAQMGAPKGIPGEGLAGVLTGLVAKGTLTQAQVDAINVAMLAAHEANRPPMNPLRAAQEGLITSTIGIEAATLKARLRAGESLTAIAGAKSAALITALVADASSKIDAGVTAGKVTAEKAVALKSNLTEKITAMVNKVRGLEGAKKSGAPSWPQGGAKKAPKAPRASGATAPAPQG